MSQCQYRQGVIPIDRNAPYSFMYSLIVVAFVLPLSRSLAT
jgi:hypothetical protein